MGRHSSSEQSSFYRSLLGWFVPWVLVAIVAGTAVWIAVGALGRGELDASPPRAATEPTETPSETPSPTRTPREEPSPTPPEPPEEVPPEEGEGNGPPPELITEGITVQVLNASSGSSAGDEMVGRLQDLGFEIVASGAAARPYDATTVFWSCRSTRGAARALAARFEWRARRAPANLSRQVSIHVVVGADEA
jgi:hypothetical protein